MPTVIAASQRTIFDMLTARIDGLHIELKHSFDDGDSPETATSYCRVIAELARMRDAVSGVGSRYTPAEFHAHAHMLLNAEEAHDELLLGTFNDQQLVFTLSQLAVAVC